MFFVFKVLLLSFLSFSALAEDIERSVKYLASDALEGRKPGTLGNEQALNFLKEELKKAGVGSLGKSYEQEFTIFTEMKKNGSNSLVSSSDLKSIKFEPLSFSLSGELKSKELVFVGFGISIPEHDEKLSYDDYKGVDVKNKIVVVMTGDPGIGNPSSTFRDPDYINYRSLFYKLKNAIRQGASGFLLINDPLSLENYPAEEDPVFQGTEGGGNRFSILAGHIKNDFVDSFLKTTNLTTKKIQQKIAKSTTPNSFKLNTKLNLSVNLKKLTGRVSNLVGFIQGSDPVLSKQVVVVGAHMDHLGYGGSSSMDPGHHPKIHNGADDNASGTALILSMAKKLKKKKLKRSYAFVFFNAEEMGLLGSSYFADLWARYEEKYGPMFAMLNFDMVGRYDEGVSVMGTSSSLQWTPLLKNIPTGDFHYEFKKASVGSSDHASFLNKKVPSLFFTTGGHEDYHRSTDTEEKINYPGVYSIRDFGLKLVTAMESQDEIKFNPDFSNGDGDGRNRGYGAHLGCVPQFNQPDTIVGVVCVRASKDSPAEIAGILPNDILVRIGDVEIKSIYDLAFALKYYRAGDKISIAWLREKQSIEANITLKKSKRH